MHVEDKKWFAQLEKKNARLEKFLAEAELEKAILSVVRGKLLMMERCRTTILTPRAMVGASERFACAVVGQHHSVHANAANGVDTEEGNLKSLHISGSLGWRAAS